jgi:hypothetical protein
LDLIRNQTTFEKEFGSGTLCQRNWLDLIVFFENHFEKQAIDMMVELESVDLSLCQVSLDNRIHEYIDSRARFWYKWLFVKKRIVNK